MDNWTTFIDSVKSISLDESKDRAQDIIKTFNLPESFSEIITSATFLLLDAFKSNKTQPVSQALSTMNELEKAAGNEERVPVCFAIGNVLFGCSNLFTEGQTKITILQSSAECFQKVIAIESKHLPALANLRDSYLQLSQITGDNQRMFYSTKASELERCIEDIKSGVDVKLSPSTYVKILTAYGMKEKAAEHFKAGDFKKALQQYHFAKNYVNGLMDLTLEKEKEINDLRNVLSNNIAVCLMKENKFDRALTHLTDVLVSDKDNVKALFRRGKCHTQLSNFDQAQEDLALALSLAPNDKEIQNEIAILNKKSKTLRDKQAAAYSKFTFDE